MQSTSFPTLYSAAALAEAKPTNRAELRKIIKTAAARFEDQIITFLYPVERYDRTSLESGQVAVGAVKVVFDESDPEKLSCVMTYQHGRPTEKREAEAILDQLCRTVSVESIGPVACHFSSTGCNADWADPEKAFRYTFEVKCPA